MICLDTNYLIRALAAGTREASELATWSQAGEIMVAAAPSWFEFLCGPVDAVQIVTIRSFVREVVPFGEKEAEEAARLFNAAGRSRPLRVDAMIAGTATAAGARLATCDRKRFEPFVAHGLQLL